MAVRRKSGQSLSRIRSPFRHPEVLRRRARHGGTRPAGETVRAIERAMAGGPDVRRPRRDRSSTPAPAARVGAGRVQLEDGTTIRDRTAAARRSAGRLSPARRRRGQPRAADRRARDVPSAARILAPGAGRFSSMPRARGAAGASAISPICAGWGAGRAQQGAGIALINPLAAAGADASAAAEPVFPVEPAFPQSAVSCASRKSTGRETSRTVRDLAHARPGASIASG